MQEPIAPIVNALNAPFWTAAAEGRLLLPNCVSSGRAFWPPSPLSPFVDRAGVEWRPVSGKGTLIALAVYRRSFQKAFAPLTPYAVGLVELDSGPRLQAHLADPDAADAARPGERVALRFRKLFETGPPVPTIHVDLSKDDNP